MSSLDNLERQARRERIDTYLRLRANRKKTPFDLLLKGNKFFLPFNKGGLVSRNRKKKCKNF